jgi:predicted DNA-binding protein (MmcQ/YjbR family)
MIDGMPKQTVRDQVLAFARSLPGAWEDFPWGERVVKVGKKIFVFVGTDDVPPADHGMGVKVDEYHAAAMAVPGAEPSHYGLGKHGWVSVPIGGKDTPPVDVLTDWVEESYRKVATKTLIKELDARAGH